MKGPNQKSGRCSSPKAISQDTQGHQVSMKLCHAVSEAEGSGSFLPATTASGGTTSLPATRTSSSGITTTAPGVSSVTTTSRGLTATPSIASITTSITIGIASPAATGITTSNVLILLRRKLEILKLITLRHVLLKELRDLLLRLQQRTDQDGSQRLIALGVKGCCQTAVTNATGTTFRRLGTKIQ